MKKNHKKNNNPAIIVPGLMGSLGRDIIPGTGKFAFGPAKHVYIPLINNLEDMGYELKKDLFIAFYNWRKNNLYSTKNYLIPKIEKVKKDTNSYKVDLICHSMGGLVARGYIQSNYYNNDVDNLIMIGTPNSGSVKAYSYWQGGILPYEDNDNNFLY